MIWRARRKLGVRIKWPASMLEISGAISKNGRGMGASCFAIQLMRIGIIAISTIDTGSGLLESE